MGDKFMRLSESLQSKQAAEEVKGAADEVKAMPTKKPDNDLVPDYAKKIVPSKLMNGKKKEPLVRYVYTHVPGNGE